MNDLLALRAKEQQNDKTHSMFQLPTMYSNWRPERRYPRGRANCYLPTLRDRQWHQMAHGCRFYSWALWGRRDFEV